jgi:hypothetical protein
VPVVKASLSCGFKSDEKVAMGLGAAGEAVLP